MTTSEQPAIQVRPSTGGQSGIQWTWVLRTGLLLVLAAVMLWLVFNVEMPSIGEIPGYVRGMRTTVVDLGFWAIPAFIGLYAAVALTPIPVTVMAVSAGILFGTVVGSAASVVGVLIGCWGAYWLARAAGHQVVRKILGRRGASIEERLDDKGFEAVFLLRVLPGLPYWPVNYGSGAFGVTQRNFVVATAMAAIPGQISLVAIGAFVVDPSLLNGLVVAVAWAVVLVMTIWAYLSVRGKTDVSLPGADLAESAD
ncbi:VTT domain-containing protein [Tessaracoccus rhinocerotis]|uniref:TVP38/TMEM64 family membrane protein n=1 Tax=Tessaracoccus rhinocerotis TaxID=1689449 RepID=A0A553JXG0_9ACTN|nr:VTT domain-containing protein [Tessaracoccus rhinocerotis]TRY17110.1 VTT domain-containing protein [Tessaracoccus rhinocerotis]